MCAGTGGVGGRECGGGGGTVALGALPSATAPLPSTIPLPRHSPTGHLGEGEGPWRPPLSGTSGSRLVPAGAMCQPFPPAAAPGGVTPSLTPSSVPGEERQGWERGFWGGMTHPPPQHRPHGTSSARGTRPPGWAVRWVAQDGDAGDAEFSLAGGRQLVYLPPPWGDCKATPIESEFFTNYSITACRLDCETRYLAENCNCRMVHMPGEPGTRTGTGWGWWPPWGRGGEETAPLPAPATAACPAGNANVCTPEQYKECADPALGMYRQHLTTAALARASPPGPPVCPLDVPGVPMPSLWGVPAVPACPDPRGAGPSRQDARPVLVRCLSSAGSTHHPGFGRSLGSILRAARPPKAGRVPATRCQWPWSQPHPPQTSW